MQHIEVGYERDQPRHGHMHQAIHFPALKGRKNMHKRCSCCLTGHSLLGCQLVLSSRAIAAAVLREQGQQQLRGLAAAAAQAQLLAVPAVCLMLQVSSSCCCCCCFLCCS